MGRKLKETSQLGEPTEPKTTNNDPEISAEKKHKKKKKKDRDSGSKNDVVGEQQHSPKRKLGETELSDDSKKKKKKKKKKESESEGSEEKKEIDGLVVVTGKDVGEAKYSALKSFADSKLPSEVLQCCQNFESPSAIQSRAWPFLLDGRDFIGIAATGSGYFSGLVQVCALFV